MKRWTKEEDVLLKKLFSKGFSQNRISKELNRSQSSVNDRLYRLEILTNKNKIKKIKWTNEELKAAKDLFFNKNKKFSEIDKLLNKKRGSTRSKFCSLELYNPEKKMSFSYKYNIGDEVNGLKIINKVKDKGGSRAYEVQSINYSKAPTYIINEYSLTRGTRDAYSSNRRICEENSLYSIKSIRKYIVNVEEAKNVPKSHQRIMEFKCTCGRRKKMYPSNLVRNGISCYYCSKGTPYPELYVLSYLDVKNIYFEYQVRDLLEGHIFDFKIILDGKVYLLETHGMGHYDKDCNSGVWDYETTRKSDDKKRAYCNKYDIPLIELDCRYSSFDFITKSINECKYLPSITNEEQEEILSIMDKNKRYDLIEITRLYTEENFSTLQIGDIFKVSHVTIGNILRKNGVKLRNIPKRVRCINTGEEFVSKTKAAQWCGLKYGTTITYVCNGERNYAGKHPETGEPLRWEDVEDQDENNTYSNNEENLHIA